MINAINNRSVSFNGNLCAVIKNIDSAGNQVLDVNKKYCCPRGDNFFIKNFVNLYNKNPKTFTIETEEGAISNTLKFSMDKKILQEAMPKAILSIFATMIEKGQRMFIKEALNDGRVEKIVYELSESEHRRLFTDDSMSVLFLDINKIKEFQKIIKSELVDKKNFADKFFS